MDAENMKSCSLFLDNINDYLDGELDEATTEAVRKHLDGCAQCRALMEETSRMLKDLSLLDAETSIPLECQAAWRKDIRKEAKRVSGGRTVRKYLRAAGAIAAAAVVILGVSRFLPKNASEAPYTNSFAIDSAYDTAASEVYTAYTSAKNTSSRMLLQSDGENDDSGELAGLADNAASMPSVIIRNAKRKIESQNFDQCVKSISDLVEEYQGYFETNTVEGQPIGQDSPKGRAGDMVARIPAVDLDAFLTGLDAVGSVTYSRVTAEDISENYYDTKARLTSYKAQLKRLNELVTTAADLEQLLMLEDKISETQYSIDSLEGTIKSWDGKVAYSTVSITVTEVAQRDRIAPPSQSLGERAKVAFYDGLNWINEFWQNLVVALAAFAPALIVIIPLIIVVAIIVALVRKKKR